MVTPETHRERVRALSPEERTRLVALGRRKAVEKAAGECIFRTDNRTAYTPSFVQKRLWFINSLMPESPAYNLSAAVLLSGELNIQAVNRAMNEIVRRHETLHTRFVCPEGQLIALV